VNREQLTINNEQYYSTQVLRVAKPQCCQITKLFIAHCSLLSAPSLLLLFFLINFTAFAQSSQFCYAIIPENPMPGEPVTICVSGPGDIKEAILFSYSGKRLAASVFFPLPPEDGRPPVLMAVLAVPATAEPGFASIRIEGSPKLAAEIFVVIKERQFNSEEIALNAALTGIRTDPDPQKTAEANQLWAILSRMGRDIHYLGKFTPPVSSTRRTSFFGDRRVYGYSNGKSDTSIHAGVDYGVPKGTPVAACAPGRVALARPRIVTGNSVVIEHLPGVYSLYYHLDKIEVQEGSLVQAGTVLGQSGETGLATGPHLHWEIRVSGENTDPDAFINRPILDKEAIFAKMFN
jgi:murein DD-endopeptidase MepM/ murein hydrolase activator NlpD